MHIQKLSTLFKNHYTVQGLKISSLMRPNPELDGSESLEKKSLC